MSLCSVRSANLSEVVEFIKGIDKRSVTLPTYLETVLDEECIKALMNKKQFSDRKLYIAFIGYKKVGYCAVAYLPTGNHLDLLYVIEEYRQQGIARQLIEVSQANCVVVNKQNSKAIRLYTSLSMQIEYDDDIDS